MRSNNEQIFPLGNSTGSGSSFSNSLLSEQWIRASFQIDCTVGALNGTFSVQVSNDLAQGVSPNQFTPTYWNTIGTQSVTCSISAGSSAIIPYFETCYKYHRLQFVAGNSGNTAGSFSARVETRNL